MSYGPFRSDQRYGVFGSSGDGKTTLALSLLKHIATHSPRTRVVVLNPGAEARLYEVFGPAQVAIDPTFTEPMQHVLVPVVSDKRKLERFFAPQLQAQNVFTYIDELALVADANRYPQSLMALMQAGRRQNCGVLYVTQRTQRIPKACITQTNHFFAGRLGGRDLAVLEDESQRPFSAHMGGRQKYEFLYANGDDDQIHKTGVSV